MNEVLVTRHAMERMAQRGISNRSMELALEIGREVEGGIMVLRKDVESLARAHEKLARRLRSLAGLRVVSSGNHIHSAYRATRSKQRRLLRDAERRNLSGDVT